MTFYEPMDVTIAQGERSSWPTPACDPSWSRIDKLRWTAGVIKARTGITVKFNDSHSCAGPGYKHSWPYLIGLHVEGASLSELDSSIDTYLCGVQDGAEAVLRLRDRQIG